MNFHSVLADTKKREYYTGRHTDIQALNNILIQYGISIDNVTEGARIIQYKATLTPSVNVNKLLKLEPNIRIALNNDNVFVSVKGNQFIIQKPGATSTIVLREFYTKTFINSDGLKLIMGVDIDGHHIYTDLAKQPHMLIAGTTGSGKSMFLHQVIASLLMKNPGIELYAVDTKQVEFNAYSRISNFHYITDEVEAVKMLKQLVDTMEARYRTFAAKGYRDITQARQSGLCIEPIVCIIDEFADLIMKPQHSKIIEEYVVRLAQKSRAAGIHLVIATQRPTADVITGLIKANIPSRVCLHVNSAMESRIVMDIKGGENLLGYGDLLYRSNGSFEPIRLQSCFISPYEMQGIGNLIAGQNQTISRTDYNILDYLYDKGVFEKNPNYCKPDSEKFNNTYNKDVFEKKPTNFCTPNFGRLDELYDNELIRKRKEKKKRGFFR